MKQRHVLRSFYSLLAAVGLLCVSHDVRAGGLFRQSTVGGISIDADGVVGQPDLSLLPKLVAELRQTLKGPAGELAMDAGDRKISLRGLEAALADALQNGFGAIPEEAQYLAGIQRIKYVLVYPEQHDIVLVGPGEGWTVDDRGNVVGSKTGGPVIHLDDFLVAMRSVRAAREAGISCSIDAQHAGLEALQRLLASQTKFTPALAKKIETTLGPQDVTITGVPGDTHFARVLAACDYRMKRIAMNLEDSPVKKLPSYLDLVKRAGSMGSATPRWWLACNYDPVARSEDGLAWELRGPGVKAMTEDEIVAADGQRTQTGKASKNAQRWADLMTEHYEELSRRDAVFGQLRNLMDLCVVAALIEKHQLLQQAQCDLPLIMDASSSLMTDNWNAPKTVPSQCSFVKRGGSYIIAASGGVDIGSWKVIQTTTVDQRLHETRRRTNVHAAALTAKKWWSN